MRSYNRKPELAARGHDHTRSVRNTRVLSIYMTIPLLSEVRAVAMKDKMSLASTIRGLICDGLMTRNARSEG
jgi:cytidylate kinase